MSLREVQQVRSTLIELPIIAPPALIAVEEMVQRDSLKATQRGERRNGMSRERSEKEQCWEESRGDPEGSLFKCRWQLGASLEQV